MIMRLPTSGAAGPELRFISRHTTRNDPCPRFLNRPFSGECERLRLPRKHTSGTGRNAALNHNMFALRTRRIILLYLRECARRRQGKWCHERERSPRRKASSRKCNVTHGFGSKLPLRSGTSPSSLGALGARLYVSGCLYKWGILAYIL